MSRQMRLDAVLVESVVVAERGSGTSTQPGSVDRRAGVASGSRALAQSAVASDRERLVILCRCVTKVYRAGLRAEQTPVSQHQPVPDRAGHAGTRGSRFISSTHRLASSRRWVRRRASGQVARSACRKAAPRIGCDRRRSETGADRAAGSGRRSLQVQLQQTWIRPGSAIRPGAHETRHRHLRLAVRRQP